MKEPQIIDDWKAVALVLYVRSNGRRCINCHSLVDIENDGVLWEIQGELMLTHKACTEK